MLHDQKLRLCLKSSWLSVTRLGDLLDFGQLFKAFSLAKSLTFLGDFCKGVNIFNFSSEINLGNFYKHLVTFYLSHCPDFKIALSHNLVS